MCVSRLSRVGLVTLALSLMAVRTASASQDDSNTHVQNHVDHGWVRDYQNISDTYIFTVYTDHNHGTKLAELWHSDFSHYHCSVFGNVNHVSCDWEVNSWQHMSWNQGPFNQMDPNDCTFNDGHGVCGHWMREIAP